MQRLTLLALALGLCACGIGEQDVEFDVDVIEPDHFDGMNGVNDETFSISLSNENPTTTLAFAEAYNWGPLIAMSVEAESMGFPRFWHFDNTQTPTLTGTGPVNFVVTPSATTHLYGPETLDGTPQVIASCSFQLNPATAAATAFTENLELCLFDWVKTNGRPEDLAVSLSASLASTAVKGIIPAFVYTNTNFRLFTNLYIEQKCHNGLRVDTNGADVEDLDFTRISLHAAATLSLGANVHTTFAAWVYNGENQIKAVANGDITMLLDMERTLTITREGNDSLVEGNVPVDQPSGEGVRFRPNGAATWATEVAHALAGKDPMTGKKTTPGKGSACYCSVGSQPRAGDFAVSVSIAGKYDPI